MTTVTDPGGTPSVVFNRSGTSIVTLSYAGSTVTIPHFSGLTVVLASGTGDPDPVTGSYLFQMSSDFDVGDVVEFYSHNTTSVKDENGNLIKGGGGGSAFMRKVSIGAGANWVALTGAGS